MDPAAADALVIALEVDHPARVARVGLHRHGDRLELDHPPRAGVEGGLPGGVPHRALVVEAALALVHRLAGVEQQGIGRHRARVLAVGVPGQALRVLGAVLVEVVVDQRQLAVGVRTQGQLAEGLVEDGRTVVAVAVGLEMGAVEDETGAAVAALGREPFPLGAPGAQGGAAGQARRTFAITGEQLHHAAGVAAIGGGEGAAQHFHMVQHVEVEAGGLALAIRGAGRDAVAEQLDPAHTEGRAGTEAARGQLRLLGIVLAVLDGQPGHAGQLLGQVDARLRPFDRVHPVHRERQVEGRCPVAAAADYQGGRFHGLRIGCGQLLACQ
ncbi:hypothetical protein D9M68_470360 [compost metagenome]